MDEHEKVGFHRTVNTSKFPQFFAFVFTKDSLTKQLSLIGCVTSDIALPVEMASQHFPPG